MYEYAKIYFEHPGNLEIPDKFRTNNGYEYDENGLINLGGWISMNRVRILPESEKGLLLSEMEMIWNIKTNKNLIKNICNQYEIDYKLNEKVLNYVSKEEFECKIKYLMENNIPLVNDLGIINKIFSMSSLNMKVEYGISLSELIIKYNISKSR